MLTGGTEFVLVKDSAECTGSEDNVDRTDTLKGCSAKCLGRSRWFIYGKQGRRCNAGGCKCFCEVPGENVCTQTSNNNYNLYEFAGLLPVLCRAVHQALLPHLFSLEPTSSGQDIMTMAQGPLSCDRGRRALTPLATVLSAKTCFRREK